MKVRNMWSVNSDNIHLCEKHTDTHSETLQDGYMYRLSELLSNYSQQELIDMERRSKLAYESVERKVFYDEMDPKDVERYKTLQAEKEAAEKALKQKQKDMDDMMAEYLARKKELESKPKENPTE